jgi:hypothetical protein
MLEAARLITPQGRTIVLSPEIYKQVQDLLARQSKHASHARIDQIIRDTYGKYADKDSLTQALLAERAAERAREDAKTVRSIG